MAGLKKRLSGFLRDKLGVTELQYKVNEQLDFQMSLLNVVSPEILKISDDDLKEIIKDLQERYEIAAFCSVIHKNDVMFQHHLYHHPDLAEALTHYFRVGASLSKELNSLFDLPSNTRLLDFGAGYGRLTRFLGSFFPNNEIVVSEVKPQAIAFLSEYLGLEGISHTADPDSFPTEKFHGILALSVFTHLPRNLFEGWFACLANALDQAGMMVFTFNDSARHTSAKDSDFLYTIQSEDSFFHTSDRLVSDQEYGLTFVSQNYLSEQANRQGLDIEFKRSTSFGTQSLAIIRRN